MLGVKVMHPRWKYDLGLEDRGIKVKQTLRVSHWQANCRDQLSLKKLGASAVNTNALTSDISGRFKRGGNSSMGLTFAAY